MFCIKSNDNSPSIASGNQICKEIWADLPKTPQNNKNDMTVIAFTSKLKKDNVLFKQQGTKAKVVA